MLNRLLALLLPCQCICCGTASGNQLICAACKADLPWLTTVCARCSVPLFAGPDQVLLCAECIQSPPPFDKVISAFHYESPINHLIHQLKFAKKLTVARLMGELLLQQILLQEDRPEFIIPVPLHVERLKQRGFNQAHEIARVIAQSLSIPILSKQIIRRKNTVEQASLPFEQRKKNLADAFGLDGQLRADYVVIVDDVMTTGYTVRVLAEILKTAGVKRVDIWCCARTGFG